MLVSGGKEETLLYCGGIVKLYILYTKNFKISKIIKNRTDIWASNFFSGYLPEEYKNITSKDIYSGSTMVEE